MAVLKRRARPHGIPAVYAARLVPPLLAYLGVETLIVTWLTADSCVLFTAADAHMRDFHVVVPPDCVAAFDDETKAAPTSRRPTLSLWNASRTG